MSIRRSRMHSDARLTGTKGHPTTNVFHLNCARTLRWPSSVMGLASGINQRYASKHQPTRASQTHLSF